MTERVMVGECPEHGYVYGGDVDNRFPNPAVHDGCGEELKTATVADRSEVEELV